MYNLRKPKTKAFAEGWFQPIFQKRFGWLWFGGFYFQIWYHVPSVKLAASLQFAPEKWMGEGDKVRPSFQEEGIFSGANCWKGSIRNSTTTNYSEIATNQPTNEKNTNQPTNNPTLPKPTNQPFIGKLFRGSRQRCDQRYHQRHSRGAGVLRSFRIIFVWMKSSHFWEVLFGCMKNGDICNFIYIYF